MIIRWTPCSFKAFALPIVIVCSISSHAVAQVAATSDLGAALKVMSFNIRFGTANDGDNHWDGRRELVADTIELFAPDVLGVQEALDFQCEFLKTGLPAHQFVGRSREVNPTSGEFCGIFFRTERFELVDSGHFWLSETPDEAGSKSWDSSLPRMVSWVRLKDRLSDNQEFIFANTHFDHRGPEARLQSAKLIRQRLFESQELPVVLTGDFNCGESSDPYNALVNVGDADQPIRDSYREIHPNPTEHDGTFSSWTGDTTGARIDWILHSDQFTPTNAEINRTRQQGRFPSDHYPVQAILKLKLTADSD